MKRLITVVIMLIILNTFAFALVVGFSGGGSGGAGAPSYLYIEDWGAVLDNVWTDDGATFTLDNLSLSIDNTSGSPYYELPITTSSTGITGYFFKFELVSSFPSADCNIFVAKNDTNGTTLKLRYRPSEGQVEFITRSQTILADTAIDQTDTLYSIWIEQNPKVSTNGDAYLYIANATETKPAVDVTILGDVELMEPIEKLRFTSTCDEEIKFYKMRIDNDVIGSNPS